MGLDLNKVKRLLTDENASKVAEEIVSYYIKNASNFNTDFEFDLKDGVMKEDSVGGRINTTIKFNVDQKDFPISFELFSYFKDSIEDISDEANELWMEFQSKVEKEIQSKPVDEMRNSLRRVVFGENVKEEIFPLKNFELKSFELNYGFDPEGGGYTISVRKMAPKNSLPPTKSVAQELIMLHMQTGKSYEQLIEEKKNQGDIDYKHVIDVVKKYYESQVYLGLYVNYSPIPENELKELLEKAKK